MMSKFEKTMISTIWGVVNLLCVTSNSFLFFNFFSFFIYKYCLLKGSTRLPLYQETMTRFQQIAVDSVPTKHQDNTNIHIIFITTETGVIRSDWFIMSFSRSLKGLFCNFKWPHLKKILVLFTELNSDNFLDFFSARLLLRKSY